MSGFTLALDAPAKMSVIIERKREKKKKRERKRERDDVVAKARGEHRFAMN